GDRGLARRSRCTGVGKCRPALPSSCALGGERGGAHPGVGEAPAAQGDLWAAREAEPTQGKLKSPLVPTTRAASPHGGGRRGKKLHFLAKMPIGLTAELIKNAPALLAAGPMS